jgi:hypothetical protein
MKHRLLVPFNRQQLELIDRTIAQGIAIDRVALLRLALREYGPLHGAHPTRQSPTAAGPSKETS